MIIEIRPASVCDVYALTRNLRTDDRLEVTSLDLDPAKALRLDFRHATVRYSAFVDTRIAAMWGMSGMMLGDIGYPWLLTTREVERAPIRFIKEARMAVAEMLMLRRRLEGYVAADYGRACRFLEALGFMLGEAKPLGKNGALFRKFERER